MKKKITIVLMPFLIFLAYAQSVNEIARNTIKSTVSIVTVDQNMQALGYGSGFYVDINTIATNLHVIEKCHTAYIIDNNTDTKYEVDGYVAVDQKNDLILLRVEELKGPPLFLADNGLPEVGERIYAVGNPKGLEGTFSEGIISGKRVFEENELLQITAPISPGSSGGSVVNNKVEFIGIAFASMINGQNLNFAIPVKYLAKLIENISSLEPLSKISSLTGIISQNKNLYNEGGVNIKIIGVPSSIDYVDYTIMNKTEYPISNISYQIIVYNRAGEVINYLGLTYSWEIPPHLAKSFSLRVDQSYNNIVTFRVLNYKIID